MDQLEQYEFDRLGYLVIKNMLTEKETADIAAAVDALETHALEHKDAPPRKQSLWGLNYHYNEDKGYYVTGHNQHGGTLVVEDFFNADPVFDVLIDHPKTMGYIHKIVQGETRINNSELRLRYPGNATGSHMGGPIDHKYRYSFNEKGIDCMMVRMIYFLHDVAMDEGVFSVVPATHKTNYAPPYGSNPDDEFGMIGLEVKAGDAILFTEHLRHAGLTNRSDKTRKTLHVGYGPAWMMSQNISTMDEPQAVLPKTLARYTDEQKKLFQLQTRK